jgi:hypothetical protein
MYTAAGFRIGFAALQGSLSHAVSWSSEESCGDIFSQ